MPPVTLTQLGSVVEGYGLKRDYVSWNEISPAAKLAAIASEDQLFPSHDGFDWKSIQKSISSAPKIFHPSAPALKKRCPRSSINWQIPRGVISFLLQAMSALDFTVTDIR